MTRREVLERYRVGIVNYRIKTLRYSQDQALSDLAQIEESERLTATELHNCLCGDVPNSLDDCELAGKLVENILKAQERKSKGVSR